MANRHSSETNIIVTFDAFDSSKSYTTEDILNWLYYLRDKRLVNPPVDHINSSDAIYVRDIRMYCDGYDACAGFVRNELDEIITAVRSMIKKEN